ncbi:DUF1643 domain-containing protein [Gimesia maris]|uniref:DUF1643 domain-containing protein n=1 Tax=Gimesia maris TaxID=122 RepID=UPI0032EB59E6
MQPIDTSKDTAIFSPCEKYRYILTRRFDPDNDKVCNFIMLNPSTATAEKNDPTVARCCKYAQQWGYGALIVTNIFAYRSTSRKKMKLFVRPTGPENEEYIEAAALKSNLIVCAWGTDGAFMNRGPIVHSEITMFEETHCLEVTKHGHPKHPLYCKGDLKPIPYVGIN